MFQVMLDENIESMICIDDDVMFHRDWITILDSIDFLQQPPLFINLGTSLRTPLAVPRHGTPYILDNNGGCEGMWVSLDFVKLFMNNMNMHHTIDTVIFGILNSIGHPILNIPVCYQTSCLEKHSTLDHESRTDTMEWQEYVLRYTKLPKVTYDEMHKEYKMYRRLKKQKEDKLFELYGKRIDVKNVGYILGTREEYCNNILKF